MRLLAASAILATGFLMLGMLAPASTPAQDAPQASDPVPEPEPSPAPSESTSAEPSVAPSESPTIQPSVEPCALSTGLVDPEATPEATCLAAQLDEWQATGQVGVGQQVNVSSQLYFDPLEQLAPEQVALVGFDLEELENGERFDFEKPPVDGLLEMAEQGVILSATWHADNPETRANASDRSFQDVWQLLAGETPTAQRFWRDYDRKLDLLLRLQTGDNGRYKPTAVIFRPFHEANGDWFWWGQGADPEAVRQLYGALQDRAAERGVHNVVWAYAANARTRDTILETTALLPSRVDLVGIDTYEQIVDEQPQAERLDLTGYADLASRIPRIAITEFGPQGSADGDWDPEVVIDSARDQGVKPAYAMLWFDDGDAADGESGVKQISSLKNGRAWLAACTDGVCQL